MVTAVKNIGFDISYNSGEDKGGEQSMRSEWLSLALAQLPFIIYYMCSTLTAGKSSAEVLPV